MSQVQNYFNPKNLSPESIAKLQKQFAKAKPFQHIVIPNILIESKASKLLKELKKEEFIEKEADLFKFKQTHDLHFAKSPLIKDFHKALCTWELFHLIEKITKTKLSGTLDSFGALYEQGSYLLCHDDELDSRKIAYIFYLAKDFTKKDGGALALYNSKNKKPTTVAKRNLPLWNSLVMFKVSPISFHEVEENTSAKPRYSIGGWFH